jgi:isocitrate dehydrogenase (NAD+)
MALRVTLIQGGGIGFDIVPAVQKILAAAGLEIAFDEFLAGGEAEAKGEAAMPQTMLESVKKNGFALKTKLMPSPKKPRHNYNIEFRSKLGAFAAIRPLKNIRGLKARFTGVDLFVFRELTEDLYASIEHEIVPGVVQSLKVVTEAASKRFFRYACNWAKGRGRKTVTCVHKANILKLADGLFLEAFRSVAKEFPELTAKEIIVDNCCMQLVSRPQQFDVLVMGNLYGDIVSDLGAGLVGGISATAGINVGDGVHIFEAFHGARREEIGGADRANPLPLLLPAIQWLEWVGEKKAAERICCAMEAVLTEAKTLPRDLGGAASTGQMTEAIIKALV